MDEKLTENQLDVLCVLWNQAYDFLDLCEETDHFVWPTTDLRCVLDSILHDIKVNPEDDKSRPPWEIGTEDLFLQTLDVYLRACRRATPYVGESDIFVRLLGLCDIMTETAFGEDDGKWLHETCSLRCDLLAEIFRDAGKKLASRIRYEILGRVGRRHGKAGLHGGGLAILRLGKDAKIKRRGGYTTKAMTATTHDFLPSDTLSQAQVSAKLSPREVQA